jgi:AraC-like DNA-binding protein
MAALGRGTLEPFEAPSILEAKNNPLLLRAPSPLPSPLAAMIYRTYQPGPPLDEFVQWFWFYADLRSGHSMERVLPDGTFELVIDLSEMPRKLFDRNNPGQYREFRGSWLSGTRADFIVIDVLQKTSMIGVHFKPGGAAAFLGRPADELTGRVEEADRIWGSAVKDLRFRLLEEPSIDRRFVLLEEFLLDRLRSSSYSDGINHAVRRLTVCPEVDRTSRIASELGISQKHFIALFRARVGLTPKKFCRIRRFQKALGEIESNRALDWAGLAATSGYYDQSHFIRDFHSFSGMNPSAYLIERGEYLGFVPVRE